MPVLPRGSELFGFESIETWQRPQAVPRKRIDPVPVDPIDRHIEALVAPLAQLHTNLVAVRSQKQGELKWSRGHRQQRPQKLANSAADVAYTTKVTALGLLHEVVVDGQAITIELNS